MKRYDFNKAKLIIKETTNLEEASLGMHEDWFWTAETIWENGSYVRMLSNNGDETYKQYRKKRKEVSLLTLNEEYKDILIGGIYESSWATPTLQLCFTDGTEKMIPCYNDDKQSKDYKA